MQKRYKFIVFSDLHLPVEKREEDFLYFLETLESCSNLTENIIFLGDIFEVWSGVSYYNHTRGKQLLEKIKTLTKHCNIYLIEGNWDFFLCKNFSEYFTVCTKKSLCFEFEEGQTLIFTHGHHFGDWQTRVLSFILTNPISYFAWKTECLKKLEVKVARKFLNKETSPLPENFNLEIAAKKLKTRFNKNDLIFCGHFHKEQQIENVFFLKDYQSTGRFYGITSKTLEALIYNNNEITTLNSKTLK